METLDPQGSASLDPKGMIGRIYVQDDYTLLYTKAVGLTVSEKNILKVS